MFVDLLPRFAELFLYQGDAVFLSVLGNPMLFVNSHETAVELLEKRSSIYSSRPTFTMVSELCVLTYYSVLNEY